MKNIIKKTIYLALNLFGVSIKDFRLDCSIDEKREYINSIQAQRKYRTFIETGTYLGETINYLKNEFAEIISIELSEAYYLKAKDRFKIYPNIKIINGDSGELIGEILKNIDNPCIFWLDGHYSSGDTAKGDLDTPIYQELKHIFNHRDNRHIILIDDARLFFGKNSYPWLFDLKRYVDKTTSKKYKMFIIKDIVVLEPKEC